MDTISDEELLAYADELLETELSTYVKKLLRHEKTMRERLKNLLAEKGGVIPILIKSCVQALIAI